MMTPNIQVLEVAVGIKNSLIAAGFTSLNSLMSSSPTEIYAILPIELYVTKLIIDAATNTAGRPNEINNDIN